MLEQSAHRHLRLDELKPLSKQGIQNITWVKKCNQIKHRVRTNRVQLGRETHKSNQDRKNGVNFSDIREPCGSSIRHLPSHLLIVSLLVVNRLNRTASPFSPLVKLTLNQLTGAYLCCDPLDLCPHPFSSFAVVRNGHFIATKLGWTQIFQVCGVAFGREAKTDGNFHVFSRSLFLFTTVGL